MTLSQSNDDVNDTKTDKNIKISKFAIAIYYIYYFCYVIIEFKLFPTYITCARRFYCAVLSIVCSFNV